jgi:spore coat protein A
MKRREFIRIGAMAGAATMIPWRSAYGAFAQTNPLAKFPDSHTLRGLGQMAPAVADTATYPGVDFYRIVMRQFEDRLHPSLGLTKLWGYGNLTDAPTAFRHLGGAVIARRGRPVRIQFSNELPDTVHLLPEDNTVPALKNQPGAIAHPGRAAVHLHGGHVPWPSDGGPWHWIAPGRTARGASVVDWLPDSVGALTDDYWYPNEQSARLMWYHDHAVGNTRLNAYAGLATAYLLTDPVEDALVAANMIPDVQIPLVFQDKVFNPDGTLWYPDFYDTQFFALLPGVPIVGNSLVPEFWGDTMLTNGTAYPYVEVEPRPYRFRLLNACNTRFLHLKLVGALGKQPPLSTEPDLASAGPALRLIGNEGGFLDGTVVPQGVVYDNLPKMPGLILAPAERADLIIDFSRQKAGQVFILHNDAPVPFPGGTPLADFFPGNAALLTPPLPGFGPNTRTLLQFRVVSGPGVPTLAKLQLPPMEDALVPAGTMQPPAGVARVRDLTLNEAVDQYGRLMQLLGGVTLQPNGGFGLEYMEPVTEDPVVNDVEIWRIFNVSADAHPIHFHLANVQVLSRQAFNVRNFTGAPNFTGQPRPADPDEMGWKETVRMLPGECTTVLMKFNLPNNPVVNGLPVGVPPSPRTGGHEYVWHCHILEHEEHDMMRPLVVTEVKP